jgi:Tfp pilus assembly protein PilX
MRINIYRKQQGAALIISLLMLLILTIIGISGMGDSIFDLRMTGNIQSHYDSMQQSDSGISAAMSQSSNFDRKDLSDIYNSSGTNALKDDIKSTVNIDYLYEGEVSAPLLSSNQRFKTFYYIVDSDHSDSATNAKTHTYQGAIVLVQPR